MSPADVAATALKRLASVLESELVVLAQIVDIVEKILAADKSPDGEWLRVRALAFELERLYTACESLLVRALKEVDGSEPTGAHHHRETLTVAAVAIDGVRPAILRPQTRDGLDALRRFRRFARHDYGTEPHFDRVDEVARDALVAVRDFDVDVRTFAHALRRDAQE
jgi:hypothetical protein